MPDLTLAEIKTQITALGTGWEEWKKVMTKQYEELKERGHVSADTLEKIAKIDDVIATADEALQKSRRIETALSRPGMGNEAKVITVDQENHRKAFNRWFRKGETVSDDGDLLELEKKVMSTTSDPDGGFFTPIAVDLEVIRLITEFSVVRGLAAVKTIGGRIWEGRRRVTGATAGGWVSEAGTRATTATPTIGIQQIHAHEQFAQPVATQTMLDDGIIDIEAFLAEEVAEVMRTTEGTAWFTGTGTGQPRGLLTFADGTTLDTIEQIASGVSQAPGDDALVNVQDALKDGYQANASWLYRRSIGSLVRQIKQNGIFAWQPGLTVGAPSQLLGRPVFHDENMPVAAANSLSIMYGDFRQGYCIVQRQGIRTLRDPFTSKPNVLFYTTARVGGDVRNGEALKIMKFGA